MLLRGLPRRQGFLPHISDELKSSGRRLRSGALDLGGGAFIQWRQGWRALAGCGGSGERRRASQQYASGVWRSQWAT